MTHHRRGLRQLLKDDQLAAAIEQDWKTADGLSPKRSAMLNYAVKLTLSPQEMVEADVVKLRDVGFSDVDVLHIAEVVGYYAYVNRIADGLGVMLESEVS